MSNLSDFLQVPIPGLRASGANAVNLVQSRPVVTIEANDVTAGAELLPTLILKTDRSVAGAGGALFFNAVNNAAATVTPVGLRGTLQTIAAGAEDGLLVVTVLRAGAGKTFNFRGDTNPGAFTPASADLTLGSPAQRWGALYAANAAVSATADLTFDGTPQAVFGTTTAHSLALKTNNTVRATLDSLGRWGLGGAPVASAVVTLVGAHPSNAAGLDGFNASSVIPATGTGTVAAFRAALSTAAAAFTATEVAGLYVNDVTLGAGSGVTSQTGVHVAAMASAAVNKRALWCEVNSAANAYNLYVSGSADNYIAGYLGIGVLSPFGARLKVSDTDIGNTAAVIQQLQGGYTGDVLTLFGQGTNTVSNLLRVSNGAGVKFYIRGDGATMIGGTAQGATSAILTVTGRLYQPANQTFDLSTNTLAVTQLIDGAITVPAGQVAQIIRLDPTVTMTGASPTVHGFKSGVTVTAGVASGFAVAAVCAVTDASPGTSVGVRGQSIMGAGHTGTTIGLQALMAPVATTALAVGVQVQTTGKTQYGVHLKGGGAGSDQYDYGVLLDNTVVVNTAAFAYQQRAANVGLFLQYVDSGATTRFSVDANGDMAFGGTGRRIRADMDNATRASRFMFQSSNANQNSTVGVLPNGSSSVGAFFCYNSNNPDAAGGFGIIATATIMALASNNVGGTTRPVELQMDGVYAARVEVNKDVLLGPTGATTAMTAGFPYIPAVAGAPVGAPTTRAGYAALAYDTTNNKLWAHNGAAWKSIALV